MLPVAGDRGESPGVGVILLRPDQIDIVAGRIKEILEKFVVQVRIFRNS